MPDLTALQDKIATLFAEKLNLHVPSPDTDLLETGILDSLQFVELLLHLEQETGIKISVDDLEIVNFCSIQRIAEFLAER